MICFTFHSMEKLAEFVDHNQFDIIPISCDADLHKIETAAENQHFFERILFVEDAKRLFSYYRQDHLNLFKIILFGSPQSFFVHKLVFADALPKSNGIWIFKEIPKVVFNDWLVNMKPGLAPEPMAVPWAYDR